MKKTIENSIIILALVIIGFAILYSLKRESDPEEIFKIIGGVVAFCFIVYKMLTGWLFINLSVKMELQRETDGDNNNDDLAVKLVLSKGNIDSLWLKDLQIRISEINQGIVRHDESQIIKPINFKKIEPTDSGDYWKGNEMKHYVISLGEEVSFSAYTKVKKGSVYAVEALILGTRPFYGFENPKKNKMVQWRSSAIVLPKK